MAQENKTKEKQYIKKLKIGSELRRLNFHFSSFEREKTTVCS
jgi:hypothetical protein